MKYMFVRIYELKSPTGDYPHTIRAKLFVAVLDVYEGFGGGAVPDSIVIQWRGVSPHSDTREAMIEMDNIANLFNIRIIHIQVHRNTDPKERDHADFEEWYTHAINTRR